jgi:DNA-binding response OmpR family regulator
MPRIAIVEDNDALISMYTFKLEAEGFTVKHARDGKAGMELVKEFKPDLILLDLRMPVMTGDEMLEKLRATDDGSSVRVVVLTNISKSEAPMSLRFLNVDRYVVKAHTTPGQVVDIVREVLAENAKDLS